LYQAYIYLFIGLIAGYLWSGSSRLTKWYNDLRTYLHHWSGLDIKDKKRQRALLLHYAGEKVFFDTLTETGEDFDTAVRKLTAYFAPKKKYRLNSKLTASVKFVKLQASQ
jgi:streptomycin 6-kinase